MNKNSGASLTLLALFLLSTNLYAVTVPKFMNIEGRLTDPQGNPTTVTTVVEYRIFWGGGPTVGDAGTLKYRETATITPAKDGTYEHRLGMGTPLDGVPLTFDTFDTSQEVFLQVNIAGSPLLPRLQFGTNPFAFFQESPAGMIAMFAGPCPSGWSRFSGLDSRFARGSASYGATGGSDTHDHGGTTGVQPAQYQADSGSGSPVTGTHSHTISSASNLPSYLEVVYCQKL